MRISVFASTTIAAVRVVASAVVAANVRVGRALVLVDAGRQVWPTVGAGGLDETGLAEAAVRSRRVEADRLVCSARRVSSAVHI